MYFEGRSDGICGCFTSQEVRKTEASKMTPSLGPERLEGRSPQQKTRYVHQQFGRGADCRYEAERHVSFLQNIPELGARNTRAGETDCPWSL